MFKSPLLQRAFGLTSEEIDGKVVEYDYEYELVEIRTNENDKRYPGGSCKIGIYNCGDESLAVCAGSSSIRDWINNFKQLIGKSPDMKYAIAESEKIIEKYGTNVTFVGHSKGGGEAMAMAIQTKKRAITFNPAATNFAAYKLITAGYDSNLITNFVVKGEILNFANKITGAIGLGGMIGNNVYLQPKSQMGVTLAAIMAAGHSNSKVTTSVLVYSSVNRHLMGQVRGAFGE